MKAGSIYLPELAGNILQSYDALVTDCAIFHTAIAQLLTIESCQRNKTVLTSLEQGMVTVRCQLEALHSLLALMSLPETAQQPPDESEQQQDFEQHFKRQWKAQDN